MRVEAKNISRREEGAVIDEEKGRQSSMAARENQQQSRVRESNRPYVSEGISRSAEFGLHKHEAEAYLPPTSVHKESAMVHTRRRHARITFGILRVKRRCCKLIQAAVSALPIIEA